MILSLAHIIDPPKRLLSINTMWKLCGEKKTHVKRYVETMWKSKLPTLRNQGFWKDMQTQHIISMQT